MVAKSRCSCRVIDRLSLVHKFKVCGVNKLFSIGGKEKLDAARTRAVARALRMRQKYSRG